MADIKTKEYLSSFISSTVISEDTYETVFSVPDDFKFSAGQYVWLETNGIRRAFSIMSSPQDRGQIKIIFRGSRSFFKKSILNLKLNEQVKIIGPFGSAFTVEDDDKRDIIMIAGGVAIAPFISLIRDNLERGIYKNLVLFSLQKNKQRSIYPSYFEELSKKHVNFKFVQIIGKYNYKQFKNINFDNSIIFISGIQETVDRVSECLGILKVNPANIRYEQFYPTLKSTSELSKQIIYEIKSNGLFLKATEGSSRHVVITDLNGLILYANLAAQKITGFSFEEMQGNTPRLWGGLMPDLFYKDLWQRKLLQGSFDGEILNRRKNGELYVAKAHIDPIFDKKGNKIGYVASEEDITAIKKIQEDLEKRTKDLERMNNLMIGRELKMVELKKEITKSL